MQRKFLWLTDLHYEDKENRSSTVAYPFGENVFSGVTSFLESLAESLSPENKFDFIGIGGDITTYGILQGFEQFEKDFFPLLASLVRDPRAICIIPGNHDVKWGIHPKQDSYYQEKFAAFRELLSRTQLPVTTCLFPYYPAGHLSGIAFEAPFGSPIYRDDDKKLLVLNLNSAVRCGELRDDLLKELIEEWSLSIPEPMASPPAGRDLLYRDLIDDVAHVTDPQMKTLRRTLRSIRAALGTQWSDYFRVALIHHHLGPYMHQHVDDRRYQHMVDSHSVLELLETFDFHMALSGHTHEAYQYKYLFPDQSEIFLVGGLTIGGHAVRPNPQGFRHILVESDHRSHKVLIKDLDVQHCGNPDAAELLSKTPEKQLEIAIPSQNIVDRELRTVGEGCDEVVSCTKVTAEGDAFRSVDYRGYMVAVVARSKRRRIELPSTSGQIDEKAIAVCPVDTKGLHIYRELEERGQVVTLNFEPQLKLRMPISYFITWSVANAFAMDSFQFSRKYPDEHTEEKLEFAFFTPDLPIRRLTIVVEFPHIFSFQYDPRIKVLIVDHKKQPRYWDEDSDETHKLDDLGALRYFRASNAYSLLVKSPKPNRSYRIVWGLRDPGISQSSIKESQQVLDFLSTRLAKEFIEPTGLQATFDRQLLNLLIYLCKQGLLSPIGKDFTRTFDATLMLWNVAAKPGRLFKVAGITSVISFPTDSSPVGTLETLGYPFDLGYGEGVAGKAFKLNRPETWIRKDDEVRSGVTRDPDYYVEPPPNSPEHSSLISFPLHRPIRNEDFSFRRDSYRYAAPFAVFSVGTTKGTLPDLGDASTADATYTPDQKKLRCAQHGLDSLFLDFLVDLL